ncbi:MAG: hypothetical protein JWN03_3824 [Nocardia sp.]|nr:hypothetical protein [Nocardia sp.]
MSNVLWGTLQQRHIEPVVLSRVNSFVELGSLSAAPIGQAGVGPIAAAIGNATTLWIAGLTQLTIAAIGPALPPIRNLPACPTSANEPHAAQKGFSPR